MQPAKLTFHAAQRLNQRCTLRPNQFKTMLDRGATVQLSQQRGGRLVHRLFYSIQDAAWFVAVQDDNDGDILTTLPLAYFENFHGHVTALNRRKARKLARELELQKLAQLKLEEAARAAKLAAKVDRQNKEEALRAEREAAKAKTLEAQGHVAAGWKIMVQLRNDGKVTSRNLGRTTPDHGEPDTWVEGHPVHSWFRERLDAMCISVRTLRGVWLERAKNQQPGDVLLEHLILNEEEILGFR